MTTEVNIKRLGGQQKKILRHLYRHQDTMFKQVEIIKNLYGDVTESKQASVSRSVSKLRDYGVVYERTEVLITPDDHALVDEPYFTPHRPRYQLTDDGERFVETDGRFPDIP
jgi:methionyl-tRNA synthetase